MFLCDLKLGGTKYPEITNLLMAKFNKDPPTRQGVNYITRKLKTEFTVLERRKGIQSFSKSTYKKITWQDLRFKPYKILRLQKVTNIQTEIMKIICWLEVYIDFETFYFDFSAYFA